MINSPQKPPQGEFSSALYIIKVKAEGTSGYHLTSA